MARPILVLNWPEKSIIPSARYLMLCPFYFEFRQDKNFFFTKSVPSSNFAHRATVKPRPSGDYIGIKISALPPTQLFYSQFTSISIVLTEISPQHFILFPLWYRAPYFLFPADLVTFTEEILTGKLHFLCSDF